MNQRIPPMGRFPLLMLSATVLLAGLGGRSTRADELPAKYQALTDKSLQWLAKQQHRDGQWQAPGGRFASALTGMAGMALLMEGSTIREGKYAANIRKAVSWLMEHTQGNGLIGSYPDDWPGYLHGHGFALLFLAQIYGEEEDAIRRRKLQDILNRAVQFTCKAQTSRGGWGYVTALEGNDWDEGSVTVTQVQALRAARNAGIAVPKETIDKVQQYLAKSTKSSGGLIYTLANDSGVERPAITVAAIASMFSTGEYASPLAKKWLEFVQSHVRVESVGRDQFGCPEYTHYYYAQVIYVLGEDGYEKMFPGTGPNERLTWSRYKKAFFEYLARTQNQDGSWSGHFGQVYTTSCYLTILQLEKGVLPFYQR